MAKVKSKHEQRGTFRDEKQQQKIENEQTGISIRFTEYKLPRSKHQRTKIKKKQNENDIVQRNAKTKSLSITLKLVRNEKRKKNCRAHSLSHFFWCLVILDDLSDEINRMNMKTCWFFFLAVEHRLRRQAIQLQNEIPSFLAKRRTFPFNAFRFFFFLVVF